MALNAVNAITAMVAPVVLLTVGGLLSNGLLTVYGALNDRVREMTRERIEILTAAIAVLGLSIVVIAIAVGQDDEVAGRVALGLVLAGTVIMLMGIEAWRVSRFGYRLRTSGLCRLTLTLCEGLGMRRYLADSS